MIRMISDKIRNLFGKQKKVILKNPEKKNLTSLNLILKNKKSPNQQPYHYILTEMNEINHYKNILDFGSGFLDNSIRLSKTKSINKIYCYDPIYKNKKIKSKVNLIIKKHKKLTIVNNFKSNIKRVNLVFSNLVFSHLGPNDLKDLLKIIYNNNCDLIFAANSLIDQNEGKKLFEFKKSSGLYQHNYRKMLTLNKFNIKWLYSLESCVDKSKKIILCFATKEN